MTDALPLVDGPGTVDDDIDARNSPPKVAQGMDRESSDILAFVDTHQGYFDPEGGKAYMPMSAQFRLIGLLVSHQRRTIGLGFVALLAASAVTLAVPRFIGSVIDQIVGNETKAAVPSDDILAILLLSLAGAVFSAVRRTSFNVASAHVVKSLRLTLFNAVLRQEVGWFDQVETGEIVNRLSSDVTQIANIASVNLSMALRYSAQFVFALVFLFTISWRLTLVMMVGTPVLIGVMWAYGRFVKRLSVLTQDALAAASNVSTETIANVRTVRAFAQESAQSAVYEERVTDSLKLQLRLATAGGWFGLTVGVIAGGYVCLVIWYGSKLVVQGDLTAGDLSAFIVYSVTMSTAVGMLGDVFNSFMRAVGSTVKVFQYIARQPTIRFEGGVPVTSSTPGRIVFDNVCFAYPSRPDSLVLNNFNLTIEPGQTVACVGESGAGKSTIAKLMLGFYTPLSGSIFIDGVDTRDYDPQQLRRNVLSVVEQPPCLFSMSIRDNITYGVSRRVTDEEVEAVARSANAHDFIVSFEQGYDTLVGERGVRLSVGQGARVTIARALLKPSSILLLDEASSALDSNSEALVQEALERLMQGKTCFVVAHRLSTIFNSDNILVLKGGAIVEQGRHDELLASGGAYRELVEKQLMHTAQPADQSKPVS